MSLDEIEERLKHVHDVQHEIIEALSSMKVVLQQHEDLLIYAHKTLDMDYHRRADESFKKWEDDLAADSFMGGTREEKLGRIDKIHEDLRVARRKLKEEFNIE